MCFFSVVNWENAEVWGRRIGVLLNFTLYFPCCCRDIGLFKHEKEERPPSGFPSRNSRSPSLRRQNEKKREKEGGSLKERDWETERERKSKREKREAWRKGKKDRESDKTKENGRKCRRMV